MKEGDDGDGTNKAIKVYNAETSSDFQQIEILKNEKKRLEMINDEKADELRKLKLVKLYRSKVSSLKNQKYGNSIWSIFHVVHKKLWTFSRKS